MGTLTITNTLANLAAGNQPLSKIDKNFQDIVDVINGNIDAVNCPALNGKESSLGNPLVDGYVLSSLINGTRSWIAQSGSGGGGQPNMQVFTSNGAWTKPAAVSKIIALVWGGGGGGGGGGSGQQGAGGGAGAFGIGVYTVSGNVTVVVGSGGAGGSGSSSGSNGNQSQITGGGLPSNLSCNGGAGGAHFFNTGGAGGSAGAGWLLGINGGRGGGSDALGDLTGYGGQSPWGGPGGASQFSGSAAASNNGETPGGGGSGGPANKTGGDGANGKVAIIWFA